MELRIDRIPTETRQTLASRARQQTIEKYQQPTAIFDQAEALVEGGQVLLYGRNYGSVFHAPANGSAGAGFHTVTSRYCEICDDRDQPAVCVHKLAIWYADLLARNAPDKYGYTPTAPASGGNGSNGHSPTGHFPRFSGRKLRRRKPRGNGNGQNHCPHCGAFLDSAGGCNKCGRL